MSKPKGPSMKISLGGVLVRAAEELERRKEENAYLAFPVRELHEHLEILRERWGAGDKTVVDEFFGIWVK